MWKRASRKKGAIQEVDEEESLHIKIEKLIGSDFCSQILIYLDHWDSAFYYDKFSGRNI
ncbi:hypothetical protein ABET51_16285 [Metabacillus fastidiosus]|uniref:hypothetical protein n=1 Tax=Metabacillus fastidiosus TaxID=1458 RepID=UPI002E210041|nr:hypothetical protein [Metabacillus fastidiosus]